MRNTFFPALALVGGLLLQQPAIVQADYIEPGAVQVKTERYHPEVNDFALGTYQYEVSWQGIPVAEAKVEVNDQELNASPFFKVKAIAKTGSFIDVFYKLRFTSESVFDAESLAPKTFYSDQKENSRSRRREVSFEQDGLIKTAIIEDGENKDSKEFYSSNITLDPISAAFFARSVPVEVGASRSFDVYNGKHRYLITFTVEGKEKLKINDKTYDTYRVVPSVQKLTDSEGEKRLNYAKLWISADESREVLKLESSVLVGKVSAKLKKFEPKPTDYAEARTRTAK